MSVRIRDMYVHITTGKYLRHFKPIRWYLKQTWTPKEVLLCSTQLPVHQRMNANGVSLPNELFS